MRRPNMARSEIRKLSDRGRIPHVDPLDLVIRPGCPVADLNAMSAPRSVIEREPESLPDAARIAAGRLREMRAMTEAEAAEERKRAEERREEKRKVAEERAAKQLEEARERERAREAEMAKQQEQAPKAPSGSKAETFAGYVREYAPKVQEMIRLANLASVPLTDLAARLMVKPATILEWATGSYGPNGVRQVGINAILGELRAKASETKVEVAHEGCSKRHVETKEQVEAWIESLDDEALVKLAGEALLEAAERKLGLSLYVTKA